MDRKTYMKEVYAHYWMNAREDIYGFPDFDKNLCARVAGEVPVPSKMVEVGIGTGFPFADHFDKAGYAVYGVDISPDLIAKCQRLHPRVQATVGDAEHLAYSDGSFDCAFCFHSSWYFPDLPRAIGEMIRVTRPGGHIYFDIQNMEHPDIAANFRKRQFFNSRVGLPLKYVKNLVKIVLRMNDTDWTSVTYEVPTVPATMHSYLSTAAIKGYTVLGRRKDDSLACLEDRGAEVEYPRLVFCITK
jgi:SAM-dependent methyltransferase